MKQSCYYQRLYINSAYTACSQLLPYNSVRSCQYIKISLLENHVIFFFICLWSLSSSFVFISCFWFIHGTMVYCFLVLCLLNDTLKWRANVGHKLSHLFESNYHIFWLQNNLYIFTDIEYVMKIVPWVSRAH